MFGSPGDYENSANWFYTNGVPFLDGCDRGTSVWVCAVWPTYLTVPYVFESKDAMYGARVLTGALLDLYRCINQLCADVTNSPF